MTEKGITNLNYGLLILLAGTIGTNIYLASVDVTPKQETIVVEKKFGQFLQENWQVQAKAATENLATEEITGEELLTNAQAFLVMDTESKKILASKNEKMELYPASTTKIVTALTAREVYQPGWLLTATASDLNNGNSLGLTEGEQIQIDTLFKALLIESDNQAAEILASHDPQGRTAFLARMNQKATDLGLAQSNFVNPQGFDEAGQKMTAFDLAVASLELLRDDYLAGIVQQVQLQTKEATGKVRTLNNTNQLLQMKNLNYQVLGVKTGTTDLAGEVLVSLLKREEQEVIVVVLGAKNRYNETIKIADYVWTNYAWTMNAE